MSRRTPIRILMLLENCPYPQDVRVPQEAEALVESQYRVAVICPRGKQQPWYELLNGVHVYRFPTPASGGGLFGYLWEYGFSTVAMFVLSFVVLVRHGFDVIHAHNPPDVLVSVAAFYKIFGKRFVFDHHDLSPELYNARFATTGRSSVYRTLVWFEKLTCRLADHVITTNASYKKVEMERCSVPENRITIVRNGPDLNVMRLVEVDPSRLDPERTTLCYVGEMGFHDGIDYLLRALEHLVKKIGRKNVICVLVGDGGARKGLVALAEQLHVTEYVQFTGWVEHEDVRTHLSSTDICVAPEPSNEYNDRCTVIKITEYMALAKPTVAFDLPEHRVTAGDAAIYATPNDIVSLAEKIEELINDIDRREAMGKVATQRIRDGLSWEHQKRHLLSAYETLTSNPRRRLWSPTKTLR